MKHFLSSLIIMGVLLPVYGQYEADKLVSPVFEEFYHEDNIKKCKTYEKFLFNFKEVHRLKNEILGLKLSCLNLSVIIFGIIIPAISIILCVSHHKKSFRKNNADFSS
ncbi:MAG: hypothetical protein LBQ22_06160 [Bacteroidales bacterium]|jgi:hypothetical protein|nr:hypothetical protein [Bacteroidales bacterium]